MDGQSWKEQCEELADWFYGRMVNRTDVFGQYGSRGPFTAKKTLTREVISRHFKLDNLIGLHSTSPEETSKWIAFDFDCHNEDKGLAQRNEREVKRLMIELSDQYDIDCLVVDSNGSGSYHVIIFFDEPVKTEHACRFGRFVRDRFDLNAEVFPKQERLPARGFGNWLRLPGRHHSRKHFTRVWNGAGWLEGKKAIDFIIGFEPDEKARLAACDKANHHAPDPSAMEPTGPLDLELSVFTYKFLLEGAKEGERNIELFNAACDFAGCGRSKAEAIGRLVPRGTADGLSEAECRQAIESAYSGPREPRGTSAIYEMGDHPRGGPAIDYEADTRALKGSESAQPAPDPPDGDQEPVGPSGGSREPVQASREPQAGRQAESPSGGTPGRSEGSVEADGGRATVSNVRLGRTTDGETVKLVRDSRAVAEELRSATGGWPRRSGGVPFALAQYDPETIPGRGVVRSLTNANELFGWMHSAVDVFWWTGKAKARSGADRTPLTKPEFYAQVSDEARPNYRSVEVLPHHPLIDNVFYIPFELPEPTGEALSQFMSRLNPATDEDRALLLAALATPAWGGPPGARPAFIIASDHGRGVGKTATVTAITEVWGGSVSLLPDGKQDWDRAKSRLLDESALSQRCVTIDNVKGKLSIGDLESMITAPSIDGKRMYVGQFSRPNFLTFFVTANAPRMSRDLAERAMLIKLGPQRWNFNFVEYMQDFVSRNRPQLLADIFQWLRQDPRSDPSEGGQFTRWNAWMNGVLSRCDNSSRLLQVVAERREGIDSDVDEVSEIREAITKDLKDRGHDTDKGVTRIDRQSMKEILEDHDVIEKNWTVRRVHGFITNHAGSGLLPELRNERTASGRFWLWHGPDAGPDTPVANLGLKPVESRTPF